MGITVLKSDLSDFLIFPFFFIFFAKFHIFSESQKDLTHVSIYDKRHAYRMAFFVSRFKEEIYEIRLFILQSLP